MKKQILFFALFSLTLSACMQTTSVKDAIITGMPNETVGVPVDTTFDGSTDLAAEFIKGNDCSYWEGKINPGDTAVICLREEKFFGKTMSSSWRFVSARTKAK